MDQLLNYFENFQQFYETFHTGTLNLNSTSTLLYSLVVCLFLYIYWSFRQETKYIIIDKTNIKTKIITEHPLNYNEALRQFKERQNILESQYNNPFSKTHHLYLISCNSITCVKCLY